MRAPGRRVRAALAILAAGLVVYDVLSSRRAESEDAWQDIESSGIVRVAMDASYPPFEWVDEQGAFHGFDVALAQALGARWGVEVQFVNIAFDGLYDALLARKTDLILSALPYDELLTRDVRYSEPYFAGGQVIVAPEGGEAIASELDLAGKVVAVELGAEGHAVISRLNRDRGLGVEILAVSDVSQAAVAVVAGEAAALICDRVDALALAAGDALAVVGEPLTVDPYVLAVRMDSPRLATEIDFALEALAQDGTLDELQRRWLAQPVPQ